MPFFGLHLRQVCADGQKPGRDEAPYPSLGNLLPGVLTPSVRNLDTWVCPGRSRPTVPLVAGLCTSSCLPKHCARPARVGQLQLGRLYLRRNCQILAKPAGSLLDSPNVSSAQLAEPRRHSRCHVGLHYPSWSLVSTMTLCCIHCEPPEYCYFFHVSTLTVA
jgi:hypothetical protein